MRRSINLLLKSLYKKCEFVEPIYEFGSLIVPGQASRSRLKEFFPNKTYVRTDLRSGPGVDRILDLHNIDLPNESVGTVIMLDVLEHVEFCRRAMEEVCRVLKPTGTAIITSVMYFPVHDHPSDYWRFTPKGFKSLLASFPISIVEYVGLPSFPVTVLAIGFKAGVPDVQVENFRKEIGIWKRNVGNSWQELITTILPPVLFVHLYRLFRKFEAKISCR